MSLIGLIKADSMFLNKSILKNISPSSDCTFDYAFQVIVCTSTTNVGAQVDKYTQVKSLQALHFYCYDLFIIVGYTLAKGILPVDL